MGEIINFEKEKSSKELTYILKNLIGRTVKDINVVIKDKVINGAVITIETTDGEVFTFETGGEEK